MGLSRNLLGCQIFDDEMLPSGWECAPLGTRIQLAYGRGLREEDRRPGVVDVYGSNGRVGSHNIALVNQPGILMGRKGTVGAVHYAPAAFWPIDTVYYVRPLADDDPRFLYHLLAFLPLKVLNAATGVPGLSRRDAYALRGAFPPLDEQIAIARVLDSVEMALSCATAAIDRARAVDHSLLHELLERGLSPGGRSTHGRPAHWLIRRVDEVADVGSGVTLGKDVSGSRSVELPYLRVANVQDGHLDLSSIKRVRVRLDEVENYRLEPGDVLMTEGGDIDKLGRGTIWTGQIPDCLHQNHIFRIRANRELLEPEFYALVVESDIAKRYFNRVAKRTTNLASTNKTQVRSFRFPVPPTLSEQQGIVAVMRASKSVIAALEERATTLRELRRSLMHDLLTGQVRMRETVARAS